MPQGTIIKVRGSVIVATGLTGAWINCAVYIGEEMIPGEVLSLESGQATIQVYGETTNLPIGATVKTGGEALSVELAPGLLRNTLNGIGRPINTERQWRFKPTVSQDAELTAGDIYGIVQETPEIQHRIMVPPQAHGTVSWIAPEGEYDVHETVLKLRSEDREMPISMGVKWPIRNPRPIAERTVSRRSTPTGWRAIDTLFPILRGGVAAIVGPYGSGKTVLQNRIAGHSDADIVVHVACGMRGNEVPESPAENAVLIVAPADAPAPLKEASIYTGMAISEYYRDMGYRVALLVDSMSRWTEALSEISNSLNELPSDAGRPLDLENRISAFFDRAGCALCLGGQSGSITAIAAASPHPGQSMSDAAQTRITLSAPLAARRQFPAIDIKKSDAKYADHPDRNIALNILKEALALREDSGTLSPENRLTLLAARMLEEDFLLEDIQDPAEVQAPDFKQHRMLSLILKFYARGRDALLEGADFADIASLPVVLSIARLKYIKGNNMDAFDAVDNDLTRQMDDLAREGGMHV